MDCYVIAILELNLFFHSFKSPLILRTKWDICSVLSKYMLTLLFRNEVDSSHQSTHFHVELLRDKNRLFLVGLIQPKGKYR